MNKYFSFDEIKKTVETHLINHSDFSKKLTAGNNNSAATANNTTAGNGNNNNNGRKRKHDKDENKFNKSNKFKSNKFN